MFYFLERNLALQAPFLHATAASTSSGGNSLFPSQHINNLNYIRNDSSQTASSNSSTTTLTPLVNARVHPHNHIPHEGLSPPQYLTSPLHQAPSQQHNAQHVQYAQGLHAVLQQVGQIFMDIAPLIIQFSQQCMLSRSYDKTIWNVILTLIYIAAATTFGFTNITRGSGVPK